MVRNPLPILLTVCAFLLSSLSYLFASVSTIARDYSGFDLRIRAQSLSDEYIIRVDNITDELIGSNFWKDLIEKLTP